MAFGAHETMEVHEILNEKINVINHLALYAEQVQSTPLKSLIDHQLQGAIQVYNQLVNYTHSYNTAQTSSTHMNSGMSNQGMMNQGMMNQSMMSQGMMKQGEQLSYQDIQYGLQQPAAVSPQMKGRLSDQQILTAMLIFHKNGAKNAMLAALECADPNLRQMLMNASITCANQAFETFFMMNQQGQYQVPTLNDQTAKTFLHTYQPMSATGSYQ
jgi:spore coat protein CotF